MVTDLGRRARPQTGSRFSLQRIAIRLRDDSGLPIAIRVHALQAAHRLHFGGLVDQAHERELRRLYTQRRRQLAAYLRGHL